MFTERERERERGEVSLCHYDSQEITFQSGIFLLARQLGSHYLLSDKFIISLPFKQDILDINHRNVALLFWSWQSV